MKRFFLPVLSLLLLSACGDSLQKSWAYFVHEPEWLTAERATSSSIRKEGPARLTADINASPSKASSPKDIPDSKIVKQQEAPTVRQKTAETSPALLQFASTDALLPLPSSPKTDAPRIVVLEEYDAATGERCRNYAYYKSPEEPGETRTACRIGQANQWVDLRPLTHKTLSPLVLSPSIGTAMMQDLP